MVGIGGMTLTVGWQMNIRLLSLSPPLIGEIYTVTSGIYHSDWKTQKNKIRPSLLQVNVMISPVIAGCDHRPGGVTQSPAYGSNFVTTGPGKRFSTTLVNWFNKISPIKSHCIVFLKTLCNKSVLDDLLPVIIVWNNKSLRYDAINL